MADLFSDLQDGSGRDYFFALESAPGGLTPIRLTLTVEGFAPTIFDQVTVFRSPATATITINGLAFAPDYIVTPAPAALAQVGQIPNELRQIIVTNSSPPDYAEAPSNPPTIAFINTVSPSPGLVVMTSLELNTTPGGNIGFVRPGVGSATLQTLPLSLIFLEADIGTIYVNGLVPALTTELIHLAGIPVDDVPARVVGHAPTLVVPFGWIDVDPQPPTTWTTTTGMAA